MPLNSADGRGSPRGRKSSSRHSQGSPVAGLLPEVGGAEAPAFRRGSMSPIGRRPSPPCSPSCAFRAMTRIHAHELGNGAAMFTRDIFADKIEAGMVGTNVAHPGPGGLSFTSAAGSSRFSAITAFTSLKVSVSITSSRRRRAAGPRELGLARSSPSRSLKDTQAMMTWSPSWFGRPWPRAAACAGHRNIAIGTRR
jgi:hypothetical protein